MPILTIREQSCFHNAQAMQWTLHTVNHCLSRLVDVSMHFFLFLLMQNELKTTQLSESYLFTSYLLFSCGRVIRDFDKEQNLGVTFNSDKLGSIDFTKI